MELKGLHLLLTYQCTYECDHCFVWGSPRQEGTMSLRVIREILRQGRELGSVEWIFFEGGEPFLYHPVLLKAVELSRQAGFRVGLVTNAYWATEQEDAEEWLRPLVGQVEVFSVSSDLYHASEKLSRQARNAQAAAEGLDIPIGLICIAQPEEEGERAVGQLPESESSVMYRGRAAVELAGKVEGRPAVTFTECPHEEFRDPDRVHIDPLGHVHLCQGICMGNLLERPLVELCRDYDPDANPVVGPLLRGGPAELARSHGISQEGSYADACHFCYATRLQLRSRFPEILGPDQAFGVVGECSDSGGSA